MPASLQRITITQRRMLESRMVTLADPKKDQDMLALQISDARANMKTYSTIKTLSLSFLVANHCLQREPSVVNTKDI